MQLNSQVTHGQGALSTHTRTHTRSKTQRVFFLSQGQTFENLQWLHQCVYVGNITYVGELIHNGTSLSCLQDTIVSSSIKQQDWSYCVVRFLCMKAGTKSVEWLVITPALLFYCAANVIKCSSLPHHHHLLNKNIIQVRF